MVLGSLDPNNWHVVVLECCDVVVGHRAPVLDEEDFEMAFHFENRGLHQGPPEMFGEARHEV